MTTVGLLDGPGRFQPTEGWEDFTLDAEPFPLGNCSTLSDPDHSTKPPLRLAILAPRCRPYEACAIGDYKANLMGEVIGLSEEGRNFSVMFSTTIGQPTDLMRNLLVKWAMENRVDIGIFLDDDMTPDWSYHMGIGPQFLTTALRYMEANPRCAVVASPYCQGMPELRVNVINMEGVRYSRREAQYMSGVVKCKQTALGVSAVHIGRLAGSTNAPKCWHKFVFKDEARTEMGRAEDFYFCDRIRDMGFEIAVAWDCWASHKKEFDVAKPGYDSLSELIDKGYLYGSSSQGKNQS